MSERDVRATLRAVCAEIDRRKRRLVYPVVLGAVLGTPGCAYGDFGTRQYDHWRPADGLRLDRPARRDLGVDRRGDIAAPDLSVKMDAKDAAKPDTAKPDTAKPDTAKPDTATLDSK
jgi:hypothetical protein